MWVLTLDEYLNRYRLLEHAVERDEKNLRMLNNQVYRSFLARYRGSSNLVLRSCAQEEQNLEERIRRRKRLCERYAIRLARGIAAMEPGETKEYARYHFLYGLTHEQFAEISDYSVRTVYRFARKAKKELFQSLLAISPKISRCTPGKFRVVGKLPKKQYGIDREKRRIAAIQAKRRSQPYRNIIYAQLRG